MNKLLEKLKGKKTYITTAVGCIYLALISLGIVPNSELVWAAIGGGVLASFRDALNHVKPEK